MVSAIELADGMDESVRAAVRLASKVAQGDAKAVDALAVYASSERSIGAAPRLAAKLTAPEQAAKDVLLLALAATGAIDDMNDARWQQHSIEELATMVSAIELADGMDESVRAAVRLASEILPNELVASENLLSAQHVDLESFDELGDDVLSPVHLSPSGVATLRDRFKCRLESAGLSSFMEPPEVPSLGSESERSDASNGDDFERWIMILENRLAQTVRSDTMLLSPWASELESASARVACCYVTGQLEANLARLQSQSRGLCRNPYHCSSPLSSEAEALRIGDTVAKLLAFRSKVVSERHDVLNTRGQDPLYLKDIVGPSEVDRFAASHSPVTPEQRSALCRVWELHNANPELALVEMSTMQDPTTALLCLELFKSLLK